MDHSQQLRPEEFADLLPWLEALAQRLVRDPGTAADLAQQTLVVAAESAHSRSGPLSAWLRRVLLNRARRHFRMESRRRQREYSAARAERLPADRTLERAEVAQQLLNVLMAQPEPYRSTLIEHFLEGRPLAEIARCRGLPAATVRSQSMRGLARLRVELESGKGPARQDLAFVLAPLVGTGGLNAKGGGLPLLPRVSLLPRLGVAALFVAPCAVGLFALRSLDPLGPAPGTSDAALERPASVEDPDLAAASVEAQEGPRRTPVLVPTEKDGAAMGPVVVGVVQDLQGRPVPGASVVWTTDDQYPFPVDAVREPKAGRDVLQSQRTATDGQGRFQLPHPGVGPLRLAVTAKGHAHFDSAELRILETSTVHLDPAVLTGGQSLVCRVEDSNGTAVVGAAVDLEFERTTLFFGDSGSAYRPLGVSEQDGIFRTDSLPAGPVRLRVTHPSHLPVFGQTQAPTQPGAPFTLQFPRSNVIEGRVLDVPDHMAISITYRGTPKSIPGSTPRREQHSGRVSVDADGRFRIAVPAEPKGTKYRIKPIFAPRSMAYPWAEHQYVLAGTKDVLFAAPSHAILKLRVVDGISHEGLADAHLWLARGHLGGGDLTFHGRVHSTEPGEYVIQPVSVVSADFQQQLVVRVPGYVASVIEVPVLDEGGTTQLGPVELLPATGRSVLVTDPEGRPVADAEVVVQMPDALSPREAVEAFGPNGAGRPVRGPWEPKTRSTRTGEDGFATIYPPPEGELLIHASAAGFAPQTPSMLPEGSGPIQLTLELGATLEVLAKSPKGAAVAGQRVFLSMDDPSGAEGRPLGSLHMTGYTDRSGLVRFELLPPGIARIKAGEAGASAEVPESGTVRSKVICRSLATPNGVVLLNGQPLSGAKLTLMANTVEGYYEVGSTTASGNGAFSFPLHPIGSMTLDAVHPSFPLGLQTEFELDEDGSPWELDLRANAVSGKLIAADGTVPADAILCVVRASAVRSVVADLAQLRNPKLASIRLAQVDPSGSFRLEGVPLGADLLLVAVNPTHAVTSIPLRLGPGTPRDGLEIPLQPASTLLVDVDLTNSPSQQNQVWRNLILTPTAGPALASEPRYGTLRSDGKARFDRLTPGTWSLKIARIWMSAGKARSQMIQLRPGQTLTVEASTVD